MSDATTLPARIGELARSDGSRVYLRDVDGGVATYADVHGAALTWSTALASVGVTAGDPVCVFLPTSFSAVEAWLGLAWLGALEVPINSAYHGPMLQYIIENSCATVMVVHKQFLDRVTQVAKGLSRLNTVIVVGGEAEAPVVKATGIRTVSAQALLAGSKPVTDLATPRRHDIASILYTSGTTGPSKGVLVPWGQLRATSMGTLPEGAVTSDDVFYSPFPLFHIGGKNTLSIMALCGGSVVMRTQFGSKAFWSDVRKYNCTTTLLLGAMANFLNRQPSREDDATSPLDKVVMVPVIAGVGDFIKRFGVRVCTVFNMTETSCPVTSNGWVEDGDESCGRVRPGYDVRLVDEYDQEVPVGQLGEMVVRASEPWAQMAGYHNMPDKTVSAWRNQWLHTGDGFIRDEEGRFFFVDRQKDAIRRRGENISSFEVEAQVNEHPAVLESAAVAVPSEWSEDEVMVVVVAQPGASVDPAALVAFLAERLPRFMVPRYVKVVDELPKTPTQKVMKAELRKIGVDESTYDAGSSRDRS